MMQRFEHTNKSSKVEDDVTFPFTLDSSPFLADNPSSTNSTPPEQARYRLHTVVVHLGTLSTGHYVAYVLAPKVANGGERRWYYTSDEEVRECGREEVGRAKAYMLYVSPERLESGLLNDLRLTTTISRSACAASTSRSERSDPLPALPARVTSTRLDLTFFSLQSFWLGGIAVGRIVPLSFRVHRLFLSFHYRTSAFLIASATPHYRHRAPHIRSADSTIMITFLFICNRTLSHHLH